MLHLKHATLARALLAFVLLALLSPSMSTAAETPANMEASLLRFVNKYYAITLTASFTARGAADTKKEFPDFIVYQTHVSVAGNRLSFLRLGFFADLAEAQAMLAKVRRHYPDAWVVKITPLEQVTALGVDLGAFEATAPPAPHAATPTPTPAAQPTPSGMYALYLDIGAKPQFTLPKLPASLTGYRFYVLRTNGTHGLEYRLNLGVFTDEAKAEQARRLLLARFPKAAVRAINSSESAQVAALPLPSAPVAATPTTPTGDDNTEKARALLQRAQDQIIARQYDMATRTLSDLLALPKNMYTADAIEYSGVANDRAGDIQRAILFYQVYLRVYPKSPGAERVRQRLHALQTIPKPTPTPKPRAPAPVKHAAPLTDLHELHVVGSLSQFYNHGATHSGTTVPTAGEQPALTTTTQSSVTTALSLTATYKTDAYDNRFVLRDFYTYSHTPSYEPAYDRTDYLSSAYFETKDRQTQSTARFGRLNGTNWGIFGRYDGAQYIYGLSPSWRLVATAGSPKEYRVDANRRFYGAALDIGPLANHWFGNLYYMSQEVDGEVDRQAVGSELRYTDPLHSVYTLFDYDTFYEVLNVGVLQVNWRTAGNLTYNLLIDHRLLPTMQTTNAVFGAYPGSYSMLEESMTLDEIRQMAKDRTVLAKNYTAGINWQLNNKWQVGGDARMYNVSGVPAMEMDMVVTPEIPATGDIYVYTLQTRRAGLFTSKDITQISLSHKSGDTAQGNALALSYTTVFWGALTVDARLRLAKDTTQNSYIDTLPPNDHINASGETTIVAPSLRLSYRIKPSLSFEAEYGYEHSIVDTDDYDVDTATHTLAHSNLRLHYFNLGYRWNF